MSSMGNVVVQGVPFDFLSDRPLAKRAEQLTTVPPSILKDAEVAAQELVGMIAEIASEEHETGPRKRAIDPSRPQLAAPKQAAAQGSSIDESQHDKPQVELLLASMMSALEQGGLSRQAFNAHSAAMRDAVRQAGNAKLADDYDAAQNAVSDALDRLDGLKNQLNDLDGKVRGLEQQLVDAEADLAALDPNATEYVFALQARDALQAKLTQMKLELAQVQSSARAAQDEVESLQQVADGLLARADLLEVALPRAAITQDASNIARLLSLMMALGELMLKTGETRSQTQRALLEVQENIRVKKLLKDAEKAEAEMKKAEAMSKTMGCVGKILGAVITAVAVVGAVFTGGASLLLAGVGLALMLADEIYHAATGNSFMEQAMKPFMKVLQPMLQFVMDKVADMLTELGVDAQSAKMAAMIAVSVAIAAVVVVLAVTGVGGAIAGAAANVVSKLGSVLAKTLEKTIAKLVPEMVKKSMAQMAKQTSNAASKVSGAASKAVDAAAQRLGLSTDVASKQMYGQYTQSAAAGLNLAKTGVVGGMDINVQLANIESAKALASMKFTASEMEVLNQMFDNLLAVFKNSFSTAQGFFSSASEAITAQKETGVAVARAVGAASAA